MIAIVDACSGNLRSVSRALAAVGGHPVITHDPEVVRRADRVVIPGQGAFAEFMRGLRERGLDQSLAEVLSAGRPMLGICLGLQVLFSSSTEHGDTAGLGLIEGTVQRLTPKDPHAKVPHVGWNAVQRSSAAENEPLLDGIADDTAFYFVHSYSARPRNPTIVALTTDHAGPVVAAIRHQNLFACQFHPEKSQAAGQRLLRNFVTGS